MLDSKKIKKLAEETYQGKDLSEGSVDKNVCRREGYIKAMNDVKKALKTFIDSAKTSSHKGSRKYELGNGAVKVEQYSFILSEELEPMLEKFLG